MVNKHDTDSIYQDLIMLTMRAKRCLFGVCESWQITPVQGMLLITLDPKCSCSMNELSEVMGCDASNITGLTDRLESNGYIERTADQSDRRVKKIKLLTKGKKCRESLLGALSEAETMDTSKLSQDEIKTLRSIVTKLGK